MTEALLTADGLLIGFGKRPLLPPISFAVRPGELWLLVGRNGSGKSTLLRTLVGLVRPVGGSVSRPPGDRIAFLPQRQIRNPAIPLRSVDLVEEGLEAGWSFVRPFRRRESAAAALAALARVEASDLAFASFLDLSEGQRQRVLMARAFVARPSLVVADEPTAAMDLLAEREALGLLDRSRREAGTAVLLVSHHVPSALAVADRLVVVDALEQTVVVGPRAEVAAHPLVERLVAEARGAWPGGVHA
ncbi:MAG: ATP-binding cassette domain-containing protein [Candidatus Sericytochromatia bacterium]|nr:ATP-binding cassette domain-containing protein [Candidatus Tanganyikabacteria bacterium]